MQKVLLICLFVWKTFSDMDHDTTGHVHDHVIRKFLSVDPNDYDTAVNIQTIIFNKTIKNNHTALIWEETYGHRGFRIQEVVTD